MAWLLAAAKPTRSSPSAPRRACSVMRRRPAPWASTSCVDLAVDAGLRQRIDHDAALPGAIGVRLPMLDGAAAADAEMRTERLDALGAGDIDPRQLPAVGMIRRRVRPRRSRRQACRAQRRSGRRRKRRRRRDGRRDRSTGAQPRRAPRKNSILPSPPVIEDGNTSMSVQPSEAANAAMSSQIS